MPVTPVAAPPIQPPVVNLVRASRDALAAGIDPPNTRWQDGFAYLPNTDVPAGTAGQCSVVNISDVPENAPAVVWIPFVAWAAFRCSAMGWRSIDWGARATDALKLATPKAVEHEFWTGAQSRADGKDNLYLAMPAVTQAERDTGQRGPIDLTPGGGAVSAKRGFSILEQAIADCGAGARGMIHVRPEATPNFTGVRRDGNLLLTHNDTIVVPGVGYPNEGPGNAEDTDGATTWMYATGLTDVRLDEDIRLIPDPREDSPNYDNEWLVKGMDRQSNTITIYAFRFAIASWDGTCHYAVRANLDT